MRRSAALKGISLRHDFLARVLLNGWICPAVHPFRLAITSSLGSLSTEETLPGLCADNLMT